jgi:hypothetical protein
MLNSGITQNITRTIVQKEALVSGRQARVRMEVAKNMLKSIEQKIAMGESVSSNEFELYKSLLRQKLTMRDFRTNPELSSILNEYISDINKSKNAQDKVSYAEFIDSP